MRWGLRLRVVQHGKTLVAVLVVALSAAAMGQAGAGQKSSPATGIQIAPKNPSSQASENEQSGSLVIEPAELPLAYPHGPYQVNLRAHGNFVPVLQWTVSQGSLPPGITLDANGILRGEARRAGEFQFMVTVRDGGKPQLAVQKAYVIKVLDAVTVVWKVPAHVNVSRIEGSVEVSNATIDDVDLTFDVKAVAEDGRATEIGYQHFPLKRGTIGMALPFGENLPHGAYMVYVNVNGEVAKRNVIYKKRLQTRAALQVAVGP